MDSEILGILRNRYEDCMLYENPDHATKCKPLWAAYKEAEEAWFIKCKYSLYLCLLTCLAYTNLFQTLCIVNVQYYYLFILII